MNIPKADLKYEFMRGTGPGGQHRNKTDSKCRITHTPTGIQASCDERSQKHSKRKALATLKQRIQDDIDDRKAEGKKADRDRKIAEGGRVRTYDYTKDEVYDHRTKKRATIKQILRKGELDRLWDT